MMMGSDDHNPKIVIRDLSKAFQARRGGAPVTALRDITLSIGEGEFVTLVGPSGCGKTTLLRCIAGLEMPSGGELFHGGQIVSGPGADRGMMFQAYALFPWKTLRENVEFGPRARGVPRREREEVVRRFIQLVGLTGAEEKYPSELSGGMQQRGALARLFANDPETMLMDEPLAAVDAQTRELLQEQLLKLWSEVRKTVVFVTHDIGEATFLSDRIVVMTRQGTIKEVFAIDLPRPRAYETRLSDEYFRAVRAIGRSVREEVDKGETWLSGPAVG